MNRLELKGAVRRSDARSSARHAGHHSGAFSRPRLDMRARGRLVTFEDATHWVLHDEAEQVSQLLIEHFSSKE